MGTPVDFDLAVLILRVLEAWELGNDGLYSKCCLYMNNSEKMKNLQSFILIQGVARAGLEGFRGTLENRRRVGRVGRSR